MAESNPNWKQLSFVSRNHGASETILLIHGGGASGADWDTVEPFLKSYHLLIPSLFTAQSLAIVRKAKATHIKFVDANLTFWQSRCVYFLGDLIKAHAKNGRAHVVGLSLGGCLALELSASHPEIVLSLFVSGLPKLMQPVRKIFRPLTLACFWALQRVIEGLGPNVVNRCLDGEVRMHPGLWDGHGTPATFETQSIVLEVIAGGQVILPLRRVLGSSMRELESAHSFCIRVVEATRRNMFTPVADSVDWAVSATKQLLSRSFEIGDDCLTEQGLPVDARVFEAKEMFHPWNRQDPELFSRCVLATATSSEFPSAGLMEVWRSKGPNEE